MRLNLICNGMMLFHETGKFVEIVIPNIKDHHRRICFDPEPSLDNLECLPVGEYSLDLLPASGKLLHRVSPLFHLMAKKSEVEFNRTKAAKVSAIITVPMPDHLRLFRSCEPNRCVFPQGQEDLCFARPLIHHDIVVFSYEITDVAKLAIIGPDGKPLPHPPLTGAGPFNWELYSTEGKIDPLKDCGDPKAVYLDSINDVLTQKGKPTNFVLDHMSDGKDDAYKTSIGVCAVHMKTIDELAPPFHSGEFGCTSVMLATD